MWMKIGHEAAQKLLQLFIRVLGFGRGDHRLDAAHHAVGQNAVTCAEHLGVIGSQNVLGAEEHLLVQFFTGSHARELDLDVGADREAGQPDQIGGDVDNPNRLAHVEEKHLTAATEGPSLEDQLDRFRNCHEIALHLRMGDGHWTARADLPQKSWNDASSAAEDISEANRNKVALVLHRCMLDNQLGDSLSRTHYTGWSHCLVGGDQNEMLAARRERGVNDVKSAENVVRDRLDHVLFH